ncbi:alpha-galactosidase [Oceanobacillus neutriphilus]|uniref:Alpha-glucosidase/alpha-galactosidase n=1 Tax=Oceanobacillus neutriphilus TaxID=531815 RepID=A0ABQ2NXX4_9BACI|nr:alpha-galactosidase [Oceanobacillus neutriphilus]GGP13259.1 alpha-glucosidase/alpha-galactosidase [Oceanobacillus neutriphilus]
MLKISIIGAGSAFTQEITVDILMIEGIEEGTIALVDIDAERLEIAHKLVEMIVEKTGKNWTVESSTNRKEVISNSDFVINQIEVAGLSTVKYEYEIPLKYGVKQCIGDTMGPGGLFKTLRTLPAWLDIVKDIEELSPNATILNYTNPMSAVTLATTKVTSIPVVGLCHSIQNTSHDLAEYLDVPYEELQWEAGGINHMSWFVKLLHNDKDMYPVLKEKIKHPDFLKKDPVKFDAMKYLGSFVSESSGHFSEYVPYYRKRQDLIDTHCSTGYNGGTGFYANNWPIWRKENDQEIRKKITGEESIDLKPSGEYAAIIIEGMVKNTPKVIYGNVLNKGLIENLPADGVVEVESLVDQNGIHPCRFGKLPEHLAALCRSNMAFFDLAVNAVLNKDKEMAMHALMVDPLSAAVCSPKEIKNMFDELFKAEREYIGDLK